MILFDLFAGIALVFRVDDERFNEGVSVDLVPSYPYLEF